MLLSNITFLISAVVTCHCRSYKPFQTVNFFTIIRVTVRVRFMVRLRLGLGLVLGLSVRLWLVLHDKTSV